MATTVRSHAKINLGLGIGAPRVDGFHGLVTLYQTLELYDRVVISAQRAAETSIRITSNDRRVPVDGRNTAWKMTALALEALGVAAEVSIHIEKRLPIQGGLGAGSANAVAALVGLEVELGVFPPTSQKRDVGHPDEMDDSHPSHKGVAWMGHRGSGGGLEIRPPTSQVRDVGHPDTRSDLGSTSDTRAGWGAERLGLAARVGSDVPLFLVGGTVLGLDRGQVVFPVAEIEATWCVVATPSVGVSTPAAFREWDALCAREGLTAEASEAKLSELSRVYAFALSGADSFMGSGVRDGSSGVLPQTQSDREKDLAGPQVSALVRTGIANDFERVVFLQHPLLSEIKCTLAAADTPEAALHTSLSGSGSALFGLYRAQGDAEAARHRLRARGVQSLLTRTLPRADYWRQMLLK